MRTVATKLLRSRFKSGRCACASFVQHCIIEWRIIRHNSANHLLTTDIREYGRYSLLLGRSDPNRVGWHTRVCIHQHQFFRMGYVYVLVYLGVCKPTAYIHRTAPPRVCSTRTSYFWCIWVYMTNAAKRSIAVSLSQWTICKSIQ